MWRCREKKNGQFQMNLRWSSRIGVRIVVVVSRRLLLLGGQRSRRMVEKRMSQIGVRRMMRRHVMRRSESGGCSGCCGRSRCRRRCHLQLVARVVDGRQFQVRIQITDRSATNQRVLIFNF